MKRWIKRNAGVAAVIATFLCVGAIGFGKAYQLRKDREQQVDPPPMNEITCYSGGKKVFHRCVEGPVWVNRHGISAPRQNIEIQADCVVEKKEKCQ